jgi:sporulation protein YlmC with PRC-barrel domain
MSKFVSRENIVGKQVIDQKASIIGKVKDVAFSIGGEKIEVTLIVDTGEEQLTVEWSSIKAVGDVVLLNKELEVKPKPKLEYIACPKCGHQNKKDARYCASCGSPLKG